MQPLEWRKDIINKVVVHGHDETKEHDDIDDARLCNWIFIPLLDQCGKGGWHRSTR